MYLQCHTWFSLRYGVLKPEELLGLLASAGVREFAHTDINNTSCCLDILRLAPKFGIRPITGIDFRNGAQPVYIGLARDNDGFRAMNEHLSAHLHAKEPFEALAPSLPGVVWIYPFRTAERDPAIRAVILRDPNSFVGVDLPDAGKLRFSDWIHVPEKLVFQHALTFRDKKDFNTHRLLRAIDNNVLLSKLDAGEQASEAHTLLDRSDVLDTLDDLSFLVTNTERLLGSCGIEFSFGPDVPHRNQHTYTGLEAEDARLLEQLAIEGLPYRYPSLEQDEERSRVIHDRIRKELSIIREKGFTSYFLINWDITSYARSKGYFYVGRGSGANSIIAYLLRITDVDPIELDLYFERFINLYRRNPPDFDIDFSWTDREDVTRYIFSRFPHVALVGAYNTFQYKAVVRELGKVFGLPAHEIDALGDGRFRMEELDSMAQLVLRYSNRLQDFPNIITPHACGILIAQDPIHSFTATILPPKGFPTAHFDMMVAEDAGLYKFDILSQRGLGKIRDTLDIIAENQPDAPPIDIHDMTRFKQDDRIRELLRTARAIGCFYVESPAMRMLLRKLEVEDYLGLVAASSVIRPGVSASGMMKEYILRHRDPDRRKTAHPVLLDIMPDTYGVMVYQEDVIKVAHYFAGLDLGEADSLRRGMSGKFRGREEFEQARRSFFEKALAKGHREEDVAEIWRQTESFAGYAFAKGHSASYAVESYQSLFLKAYYPLEYMTATINNFGGFYSTELYVHEARLHGAQVEAPCVNDGALQARLLGERLLLGFNIVKDLSSETLEALFRARDRGGAFLDLGDLIDRVPLSLEQATILVRTGALRFTGRNKKDLLWEIHFRLGKSKGTTSDPGLFREAPRTFELPALEHSWLEDAYDELELIGFPLCSPFDMIREEPGDAVMASDLSARIGEEVIVVGYLVTVKPTRTQRGERMYFGTFVDRSGAFLDTVHFPPVAGQYAWRGRGVYEIHGTVTEDFGAISIEASYLQKIPYMDDPRYADLRTTERMRLGKK